MDALFAAQKSHFNATLPRSAQQRIDALKRLKTMVLQNEQAFIDAIHLDFGRRASAETQLLELLPLMAEIRHCIKNLKRWMRPKRVSVTAVPLNFKSPQSAFALKD